MRRILTASNGVRGRRPAPLTWAALGAAGLLLALVVAPTGPAADLRPAAPSGGLLALAIGHVLALAGFLVLRARRWRFDSPTELPRHPLAREAWRQFLRGLDALVVSWVALYAWLSWTWASAFLPGLLPAGWTPLHMQAVGDVLNTAGSVAFLYLFLVLDRPSVPAPDVPGRDADFRDAWCVCLAIGLVVALAAVAGQLGWLGIASPLGPKAGSFLAAVAMMYLFGRFDYRSMRVGRLAVAPLYLYVALQVAWDQVSRTDAGNGAVAAFGLALALKLYLLWRLVQWARDRRLQRYFDFAAL